MRSLENILQDQSIPTKAIDAMISQSEKIEELKTKNRILIDTIEKICKEGLNKQNMHLLKHIVISCKEQRLVYD